MIKIYTTIFIIFFTLYGFAQSVVKQYKLDDYNSKIDSLAKIYDANLVAPKEFQLQCYIAISHYPELKGINITFVYDMNISTTMQCRPTTSSFISNSQDRCYTIYINDKPTFEGILLKDVPFNAQIGIIGHEIAHILDYESKNRVGVIGRGYDYLSDESKKEFEYEIDLLTIKHGLGWQLYDWADYAMFKSKATNEYKEFKKKIYMLPSQILKQISLFDIYKNCR